MKTQINNIKKTKNKKSLEVITVSLVIEIKKTYKKSRSYSESLQIVNKGQGDDDDDEMEGANLAVYCTFDGPQTGRFEARLLNLTSNKRLGVGARV